MGAARAELIDQLRPYVGDPRVLAAIAEIPRERFVDPMWADRAWDNAPLPIGEGQTISQPLGVARMCALVELARSNLAAAGIDNVTVVEGDGSAGHPEDAPYDAINVAAAAQGEVPPALEDQLAPGGRLVAPVEGDEQRLGFVRRDSHGMQRTGLE